MSAVFMVQLVKLVVLPAALVMVLLAPLMVDPLADKEMLPVSRLSDRFTVLFVRLRLLSVEPVGIVALAPVIFRVVTENALLNVATVKAFRFRIPRLKPVLNVAEVRPLKVNVP